MATLKQLKTFVAVAEYKKMSDAARHLYISQPTVSQTISDLEQEYGIELFERLPRELKITPAGQIFLTNAQNIISSHEHLDASMKNIGSRRSLRVGATLTIGDTMLSQIIESLNHSHSDLDISAFVNNTNLIEQRLVHNELDIALVEGVIIREEIITKPIMEDNLVIICGNKHPFAARQSIRIEDLHGMSFILRERGSGTRAVFENIMLAHHIPVFAHWECSSSTAIMEAVAHNLGLGVISHRYMQDSSIKKQLHECPVEQVSMKRYFSICYNQNHPVTSQMQDFIGCVQEERFFTPQI